MDVEAAVQLHAAAQGQLEAAANSAKAAQDVLCLDAAASEADLARVGALHADTSAALAAAQIALQTLQGEHENVLQTWQDERDVDVAAAQRALQTMQDEHENVLQTMQDERDVALQAMQDEDVEQRASEIAEAARVGALHADTSAALAAAQRALQTMQDEHENVLQRIRDERDEALQANQDEDVAKRASEAAAESAASASRRLLEGEVESVRAELENKLETAVADHKLGLKAAEMKVQAAEMKLDSTKLEVQALHEDALSARHDFGVSSRKAADLEAQLLRLQARSESEVARTKADLEGQLSRGRIKVESELKTRADLEAQLSLLKIKAATDVSALEDLLRAARSQHAVLRLSAKADLEAQREGFLELNRAAFETAVAERRRLGRRRVPRRGGGVCGCRGAAARGAPRGAS